MAKHKETKTPVGRFLFPKLTPGDPDIYTPANGGEVRKYKTGIVYDDMEELSEFKQLCQSTLDDFMEANGIPPETPIKEYITPNSYEKDGEVITDGFVINVDMKAMYMKGGKIVNTVPKRFGADGKPLADDVEILGGSTGRAHVALKPYHYTDKGYVGLRLMLYAVQVKELYGGESGFDALIEEDCFDEA